MTVGSGPSVDGLEELEMVDDPARLEREVIDDELDDALFVAPVEPGYVVTNPLAD